MLVGSNIVLIDDNRDIIWIFFSYFPFLYGILYKAEGQKSYKFVLN